MAHDPSSPSKFLVSETDWSPETCVQVAHTRHKKLVPETWRLQFRRFTSTANDAFSHINYASFSYLHSVNQRNKY